MKTLVGLSLIITSLVISGMVSAQQNVSGGGAVSIVQGGNTAIVSAGGALKVDTSGGTQAVTGTFWQATQPVSGTVSVNALPTGSNLIGKVNIVPLSGCGGVNYDSGLVSLPNTSTVLTATATCVTLMGFNNITASAQTITVSDNQGSPVQVFSSYAIPANSQVVVRFEGIKFLNGIKWQAGNASAVVGWVKGDQ